MRSDGSAREVPAASKAVRRAMIERLSTLASPEIATRIVDGACAKEDLEWVPEVGLVLSLFIHGPLHDETARVLGEDAAHALVHDLTPMVRMNQTATDPDESQVRLTFRPEHRGPRADPESTPLMPPPNVDEAQPLTVLVATRDDVRVDAIATAFGGWANVQRIDDVLDLFDAASHHTDRDVVVVLDARDASVGPSTLAAAHEDLPERCTVVLWGVVGSEREDLEALFPAARSWTALDEGQSAAELAAFVQEARRPLRVR